jgi:hypothetical protein
MPEENTWYAFTKENISTLKDDNIGIYMIGDINKVPVYIGSSTSARTSIKGRLMSHLRNKRCPKGKYFLCTLARGSEDPEQLEAQAVFSHVRKYRKLPIYVKALPRLYKLY